ncbi:hypothetical protein [Ornithinimicrobium sufpigmenti]|uniref:hypothetical protein n=1 Tax=Ornithinimicrobium sufpigmenti TaxID=2508882 RepID=UPI001036E344|nr:MULTISPECIES: hypothetical protein [unclassified Ornithinimicrobium]
MTITRQHAHGLPYDSYSLHALRALPSLDDVRLWAGLGRPAGTNYGASRNPRGAPIRLAVQHIAVAAEMRDPNRPDTSAESVTAWGLNPTNRGASWPDCTDRDSWVPYLPAHLVRTWTQGKANRYGLDWNTIAWGQEQGIWDPNWNAKPDWFVKAHLRMSAAAWALVVATWNIPLKLILNQAELYRLATAHPTAPIGFSEHWVIDPEMRNDAGRWPLGGNRTTFPWDLQFQYIQEELAIRTGSIPGTPDLPAAPSADVKAIQEHLNFLGAHLDVDGYWGPLTLAVAHDYADVYGYPGDVTNHRALLTHLESTMQNVLTLLQETKGLAEAIYADQTQHLHNRVVGTLRKSKWPGAGNATFEDMFGATWMRAGKVDPVMLGDAVKAALAEIPGGASVDADAVAEATVNKIAARLQED